MSAPLGRLLPDVARMSLSSLRANRLRSLLTILGVVIGVATVVAMASIIQGFDRTVSTSLASFGSHVIYVRKMKPGLFTPALAESVRHRHAFTPADAEAIRRSCPDVREISIIGFIDAVTLSHGNRTTRGVQLIGADERLQEVNAYDPWLRYGSFWDGAAWTAGGVS